MIRTVEVTKDFMVKELLGIDCAHENWIFEDDNDFIYCPDCREFMRKSAFQKFEDLHYYFDNKQSMTGGYFFNRLLIFLTDNLVKLEIEASGSQGRYNFCMWLTDKKSISSKSGRTFEGQLIWCSGILFKILTEDRGISAEEVRGKINGL